MDFNLSDEQQMLRDGLGKFLSARYTVAASRAAAKTGNGWQPEIWNAFASELGILGATLPEEVGGSGGAGARGRGRREGGGRAVGTHREGERGAVRK